MCAYLRVDLIDGDGESFDKQFADFANWEGFDFVAVFRETDNSGEAFEGMLPELRRTECRHVTVVSMRHLDGLPEPREVLVKRLLDYASACVWVAGFV